MFDKVLNMPLRVSLVDKHPFKINNKHCVKIAQIESLSGPYLVQMRENTDQKNSILIIFMQSKTLQQRL